MRGERLSLLSSSLFFLLSPLSSLPRCVRLEPLVGDLGESQECVLLLGAPTLFSFSCVVLGAIRTATGSSPELRFLHTTFAARAQLRHGARAEPGLLLRKEPQVRIHESHRLGRLLLQPKGHAHVVVRHALLHFVFGLLGQVQALGVAGVPLSEVQMPNVQVADPLVELQLPLAILQPLAKR
eukprot:scaffold363_cov255-Pinguiococcus_pyrenoidosus.AAC.6